MAKTDEDFRKFGFQPNVVEEFRHARRGGEWKPLNVHIYQPEQRIAGPVLVWFHGGGFRTGRVTHASHRTMARRLCKAGLTVAFPEYRLGAQRADLDDHVSSNLEALDAMAHEAFPARFRQSEAMAALEDAVAIVAWLENRRELLGFDGQIVVGGSSAGAIIALKLLYVAPFLRMNVPQIGGAISISGGMAFPELSRLSLAPVFALHNPNDDRVPYKPISDLADANPSVSLITSTDQIHGSLAVSPDEPKSEYFGRMISKVHEFAHSTTPSHSNSTQ